MRDELTTESGSAERKPRAPGRDVSTDRSTDRSIDKAPVTRGEPGSRGDVSRGEIGGERDSAGRGSGGAGRGSSREGGFSSYSDMGSRGYGEGDDFTAERSRRYLQISDRSRCRFCREKVTRVDYKDVLTLQKLCTNQGRLFSRKRSGNCAAHQRMVKKAVKQARYIGLLNYTA